MKFAVATLTRTLKAVWYSCAAISLLCAGVAAWTPGSRKLRETVQCCWGQGLGILHKLSRL